MKKALVLSLIIAVGLGFAGFAQTLSGTWDTDFELDLAGGWPGTLKITTVLDIDYVVGDWTFGSYTKIIDGAWSAQYFDAAGVLGAFTLTSKLEFDPSGVAFSKLTTTAGVSIAGVTFGAKFILIPNSVQLELTGSGVAGDVSIGVKVVLGDLDTDPSDGCDLDFNSVRVDVDFPFCCALVDSYITFGCAGFEKAVFCVSGITIENLPWLTLKACVEFQTASKTVTLTPTIDLGVIGCDFDLYYRLKSSGGTNYTPLLIDGIQFDGIQIACEIGGVAFTGITYWGLDDHGNGSQSPGILAGYEEYWEAYQIATTDDGCCGPFSFDVTVFFDEDPGATELFDVAYLVANMSIQIATQFTFDFGLETDLQNHTVDLWKFGFKVTW